MIIPTKISEILSLLISKWQIVLATIALIAFSVFLYRACNRPPKLDEKQIQKAQQAIAANDRQAMVEVLIAAEVAEKKIDANVVDASTQTVNAIVAAKKKANEMSNEELANYLNERSKE